MNFFHQKLALILTRLSEEGPFPAKLSVKRISDEMNAPSKKGNQLLIGRTISQEREILNKELQPFGLAITGYEKSEDKRMQVCLDRINPQHGALSL